MSWNEFDMIDALFAPLADNPTARGLQDDAAQFRPPAGFDIVISTDALVSGVHFPKDAAPEVVARRAVACNLSDLAAKGATPCGCLLNLGVGDDWDMAYLSAFAAAFGESLAQSGLELWGGDTVSSPTPFVALTVHGIVPEGKMLLRSGAESGDVIYLTGVVGDAWLGLQDGASAYSDPQPPLNFGQGLIGLANAALDISDGLMADLDHMCRASHVSMDIELTALPLSLRGHEFVAGGGDVTELISGGDDLQIAFAAPSTQSDALHALATDTNTQITAIGKVNAAQGAACRAVLRDENKSEVNLAKRGYRHF